MPKQDEFFLDRLRQLMRENRVDWVEKRMFGGTCFMVDDKMCFGTFRGGLMARVGPDEVDVMVKRTGAEQMMQGSREMKGYLFIQPEGYDMDEDLEFWVKKCLEFNPKAKASKKKK